MVVHAKPPIHPATLDDDALLGQCQIQRTRGSGPGGQHRNKVETAIRITHTPTGNTAQASERRSQAENQRVALRRLRMQLALKVRCEMDPDGPSELWRSRVRKGRISVNPKHADVPLLLAEAMDAIAASAGDVGKAAACLGVSMSQLVKLLKIEPAAFAQMNEQRKARGLSPLR